MMLKSSSIKLKHVSSIVIMSHVIFLLIITDLPQGNTSAVFGLMKEK